MEDDTPPRFDFKRCNITDFRRLIKETDWAVLHKLNVEECWNLIYSKLDEGMEKFVPKVDIKSRRKSPPWMNPFVKKSIKKKHKLFKKLFNSNNSYVYKLYMNARNESARIVKNAKKNYQKDMASKIESNPKVFWRYINSNRKNKDGIAPLSTDNINFETNNKNKADMLNNFFSSVFTVEDLNNIPDTTPGEKSNNCFISDIIVTELLKLKINKSPGPDKLFPLLLFILSEELALPITILFNKSLETGVLPSAWKHAEVTPIFKKGSKVSPNNYRPVSLTSILCKTLESFVRDSIQEHMESLNLYTDCQHGFRTGRSCVSQLLEVFNDFSKFSDSNDPFDVIYLDFAKAFDTVPHERLLRKMSAYGIGGNILKWTKRQNTTSKS